MFFLSGARVPVSVAGKFRCNFAGIAQVGTNLPPLQTVPWTWRDKPRKSCCSQAHDRCINNSHALCVIAERLTDDFGKSTGCKFSLTPGHVIGVQKISMFALKSSSTPTLEFAIFRFPWISRGVGVLCEPQCFFGRTTEMCITRSSMDKVLSRALSTAAKQNPAKGEPVTEVQPTRGPKEEDKEPEHEKNQSKTTQLKKVFKEYGAVGVSFHVGISLISLGIFYIAVSSGINMAVVLCKMGFNESVVQSKMAAGTSTFVLAYAVHKLFAPLRISITLVSVPLIVRYLRKTGLFKPPPSL